MIRSFLSSYYGGLFTGLVFFVMTVSIVAPRAASFAAPVAGLILFIAWWISNRHILKPSLIEIAFMIGIPALIALSSLWAIDPPFALERAGKLFPLLLCGLFFIEAARRSDGLSSRALTGLIVIFIVGCVGVTTEIVGGLTIYKTVNDIPQDQWVSTVMMNRSVIVLTAFFIPLMLMLYKSSIAQKTKIILGGLSTLMLITVLSQTESQSAQLFFILAAVFVFLFPASKRSAWIVLGTVVCAAALTAPWLAQFLFLSFPPDAATLENKLMKAASIPHRLELWNFVATEALKHPWIGQGVEAIRYIKSEQWLVLPNTNNMLHPHNAPLQLWVEFGVIGATAGCALFVYIMSRLWKAPEPDKRAGLAVLMATLAVMSTGYGLWQSWQIGMLIGLSGLMALAIRSDARIKP